MGVSCLRRSCDSPSFLPKKKLSSRKIASLPFLLFRRTKTARCVPPCASTFSRVFPRCRQRPTPRVRKEVPPARTGVPRSKTSPRRDPATGLCLGLYGGPWGGRFLMSEVPLQILQKSSFQSREVCLACPTSVTTYRKTLHNLCSGHLRGEKRCALGSNGRLSSKSCRTLRIRD